MMRGLSFTFIFCLIFLTDSVADTSDSISIVNSKIYGNCQVSDRIDMLTDDKTIWLACGESTITDITAIFFVYHISKNSLSLGVSKRVQFHIDDTIPVAIRIDKGKVLKGNWIWQNSKMAWSLDESIIKPLLSGFARGKRMILKVGDERGDIVLTGSTEAVADFKTRIKKSG